MSALGQERTSRTSFDHVVGAGQDRLRYRKTERLGRLEVYHQLVLGRSLYRKVAWLFTFENAVNIPCRAPMRVDCIGSVGNQPTSGNKKTKRINRGQFVLAGELDDLFTMIDRKSASRYDKAAIRGFGQSCDGPLDLTEFACIDRAYIYSERRCYGVNSRELANPLWCPGIANDGNVCRAGCDLLEQLQPFPGNVVVKI